jgi:predicted phosphodiesterase
MLCYSIGGVMMYLCHGHREDVKRQGTDVLALRARQNGAQMALYGHTHRIDCRQEEDGLWVLNPGPATHSAGLIKTDGQALIACYILTETDLEDWV